MALSGPPYQLTPQHHALHFNEQFFENIEQRSAEWLAMTQRSVGGSRAGALINVNPYMSFEEMIETLLCVDPPPRKTAIALELGQLMEPLHQQIASITLASPIREAGVYRPNMDTHFSPDGIGIDRHGNLFLCEYKTPFYRRVLAEQRPAQVKEYYRAQCQYSMMLMPWIRYTFYQELALRFTTPTQDSALNFPGRWDGRVIFGDAYCEFYSPEIANHRRRHPQAPTHLLNFAALPHDTILTLMSHLEMTRPWDLALSGPALERLGHFQATQLQYGRPNLDFHEAAPILTTAPPNCFLRCKIGNVYMERMWPDPAIHKKMRAGLARVAEAKALNHLKMIRGYGD